MARLILLLTVSLAAHAADIAGNWKATAGDTIKLTSSFGDSGQTIEWSGKRVP